MEMIEGYPDMKTDVHDLIGRIENDLISKVDRMHASNVQLRPSVKEFGKAISTFGVSRNFIPVM